MLIFFIVVGAWMVSIIFAERVELGICFIISTTFTTTGTAYWCGSAIIRTIVKTTGIKSSKCTIGISVAKERIQIPRYMTPHKCQSL